VNLFRSKSGNSIYYKFTERSLLLVTLVIACFALFDVPNAFGVSPAPDGGYSGQNTAEGDFALFSLTTGFGNTANGYVALYSDTTGDYNTAIGHGALLANTTGNNNTATGSNALFSNIAGTQNTATGSRALFNNTGSNNTADGYQALFHNTTGSGNTANGLDALYTNNDGNKNTATGNFSLYNSVGDLGNTAEGYQALYSNNGGSNNVAVGYAAGYNLTTGNGNVCIGQGVFGVAGESNTTHIRNVYSSVASGRAVYVNANNKIGTLVSSRRFKDEIKPMDKASETILALKPVTFRYKKEIEPNGAIMFGLIAEEVEKVDPDLVTRNDKGEAEAVRYDAVNTMLLNEFLKAHRAFVKEQRKVDQQEVTIGQLKKQVEALTRGLQKVSDELQLSKPAPQTVLNQ
jgi:hypothetical protein